MLALLNMALSAMLALLNMDNHVVNIYDNLHYGSHRLTIFLLHFTLDHVRCQSC